jgi:hypothetical protein
VMKPVLAAYVDKLAARMGTLKVGNVMRPP